MKHVRLVAAVILGMSVSGCATMDIATRNAPFVAPTAGAAAVAPSMKVVSYDVRVPHSLKVSEANSYYPAGDIVWHGDPMGDRYAQVEKIFDESIDAGIKKGAGKLPVVLDIEVTKFHALSEKTRYTIGGRHEIRFVMNFLDPKTRQPVAPARKIDATFKGFGGARAVEAEEKGLTQRVRIVSHLTNVFRHQLGLDEQPPAAAQPDMVSRNLQRPLSTSGSSAGVF
jgi:hypothetical protein